MAGNNRPANKDLSQQGNGNKPQQNVPIDPETIRLLIENQRLELHNQKEENDIRRKELDINARLAEKSMEIQREVLATQSPNFRRTLTRIAVIFTVLIVIILIFLGLCLYLNKEDFAYKFIMGLSYLFTTVAGYYFGRRTQVAKKEDPDQPTQIFQ